MTDSRTDAALALAASALAVVLDLEADDLRADRPLADLGADSVALVCWADVAEDLARGAGRPVAIDDTVLRSARTVGDLATGLAGATAVPAGAGEARP